MSKKREKITLTEEECEEIDYEAHPDFDTVKYDNITYYDTEKGMVEKELIIMRKSDGKLFRLTMQDWGKGNKEYDTTLEEVFAKTIKSTIYE